MDWRKIPGEDDAYEINELGEFRSRKHSEQWRPMKTRIGKVGYPVIALCQKGVPRRKLVHRLLAQVFIPNPMNFPEVNHINGNKADNRLENLEWCTHGHNLRHAIRTGLVKTGDASASRKITDAQAAEIYDLVIKKGWTHKKAAEAFNISQAHVGLIAAGYRVKYRFVRDIPRAVHMA
jgi:hypothetical protein